jgi:flagellar hook-associated protein 3 FlgL
MTALETSTKDLTAAQDQLMVAVTRLGSTQNRIDTIDENLQDINTQQKGVVSDNIDVDVADLIVKINVANNAYQASLNAAARVIQPSLLDYIS